MFVGDSRSSPRVTWRIPQASSCSEGGYRHHHQSGSRSPTTHPVLGRRRRAAYYKPLEPAAPFTRTAQAAFGLGARRGRATACCRSNASPLHHRDGQESQPRRHCEAHRTASLLYIKGRERDDHPDNRNAGELCKHFRNSASHILPRRHVAAREAQPPGQTQSSNTWRNAR
jgi:hypothetical protein